MHPSSAPLERVDGFDAEGSLVAVIRHEAPSRLKGGRDELKRRRCSSLAKIGQRAGVVRAELIPVQGEAIPFTQRELMAFWMTDNEGVNRG